MISGLIIGFRAGCKLWFDLRWVLHVAWLGIRLQLYQNWRDGVIRKILCNLCAEAAVLALIFPFLDVVVANNEMLENSRSGIQTKLIPLGTVLIVSLSFVALALFGAFILGSKKHGD